MGVLVPIGGTSKSTLGIVSGPVRIRIFEATAAAGIFSGRGTPSTLNFPKFVETTHTPIKGAFKTLVLFIQPFSVSEDATVNVPSSAMGIPWTLWVLSHHFLL